MSLPDTMVERERRMSDLNQIHTVPDRLFNEEWQRIVFWNDPDEEFPNTLPFVVLDGVTTLRLDEVGARGAKIRVEREDSVSSPFRVFRVFRGSETR